MFEWLFGRKDRSRPQAEKQSVSTDTGARQRPALYLAASNGDFRDIVEGSDHQDALARIRDRRAQASGEIDVNIVLRHEPGNPPDINTVAVVIEAQEVGYLSREDALVMNDFCAGRELSKRTALVKSSEAGVAGTAMKDAST